MEKRKQKNSVFYISLILIAIMAVWSVAFNESFTKVSDAAFAFLTTDFGWLYLLAMIVFLVFVLYVAFGLSLIHISDGVHTVSGGSKPGHPAIDF